jgi:diguanylate cyclase (GGDEF)-like protein
MLVDVRMLKHYHVWALAVPVLLVAGTALSLGVAAGISRSGADASRKALSTSSAEIAANLKLSIQHEEDLLDSAQALVLANLHITQAEFAQWARDERALERYPEVLGLGLIQYVSSAQLAAYAKAAASRQGTPFQVIPPGKRPFYCFTTVGTSRSTYRLAADTDVCAGPGAAVLLAARESGRSEVFPYASNGVSTMSLEVPVYRGGSVPTTLAGRERAFVDVIGMSLIPVVLLDSALAGHPSTTVALRFDGGGPFPVEFRSGAAPRDATTVMINLRNDWTVLVSGQVEGGGLLGDGGAVEVLVTGVLLSALLATLVLVLGTGRARALELVGRRTHELRHQALHDSLTGLPNRALILDRMDQLLARNRRNGTLGAALYVDLDDFKNVNDSLGHHAGDRLLVSVADRMASTLRDADTIGRMGGDEFVVLIDGGERAVAPELVAQRLLDVMGQPFDLEGAALPMILSTSIGIAVGDRPSGVELLRDADVALYQAKSAGKNCYELFHPEMQTEIGRRIGLEFDLRSALSSEQFRLVYQPIYDLEDLAITGVEALLRWEHPLEGTIQPDEFIPILEQTGQIREVGHWVLRRACEQTAAWRANGDSLDVSINVSGRQLDDDSIVAHIRDALALSGLDATSLIIEVTETALMRDAGSTVRRLWAIKDLGVRIAVDDFGTGYSSLAYLQQFPVDYIKIDKAFTKAMATSPEANALVRTFVQLGKDLGLKTLAEGVETSSELELLRADHVNQAQGFLLSRPLDPETLETKVLRPLRLAIARTANREGTPEMSSADG